MKLTRKQALKKLANARVTKKRKRIRAMLNAYNSFITVTEANRIK